VRHIQFEELKSRPKSCSKFGQAQRFEFDSVRRCRAATISVEHTDSRCNRDDLLPYFEGLRSRDGLIDAAEQLCRDLH
jgi:hypothetical protein